MAKRVYATINGKLLAWARESAGYSVEDAAQHLGFGIALLKEMEHGKTDLTGGDQ